MVLKVGSSLNKETQNKVAQRFLFLLVHLLIMGSKFNKLFALSVAFVAWSGLIGCLAFFVAISFIDLFLFILVSILGIIYVVGLFLIFRKVSSMTAKEFTNAARNSYDPKKEWPKFK